MNAANNEGCWPAAEVKRARKRNKCGGKRCIKEKTTAEQQRQERNVWNIHRSTAACRISPSQETKDSVSCGRRRESGFLDGRAAKKGKFTNFSAYGNHFHEPPPLANNSAQPGQAKKLVIKNSKGGSYTFLIKKSRSLDQSIKQKLYKYTYFNSWSHIILQSKAFYQNVYI